MKKSAMNLPNTLSIIRCLLVPAFVASLIYMREMSLWGCIVPAIIYALTALTDMLDGQIARRCNLVTDFGKFIDPLADKFMVLSSMISILVWMMLRGEETLALVFMWVVLVILFRELGVTSLRLVVAKKKDVALPADILGKIKTVSQMVGTVVILLEPLFVLEIFTKHHLLSYIMMGIMLVTTIVSGINYLLVYLPHIDSNK